MNCTETDISTSAPTSQEIQAMAEEFADTCLESGRDPAFWSELLRRTVLIVEERG